MMGPLYFKGYGNEREERQICIVAGDFGLTGISVDGKLPYDSRRR